MARLVSSFGYGHTALRPQKYHSLPINLYHFKDGIFIEGIHKDYEQALGAKVTAIEGIPINEVLAKVRPVVPAENDQFMIGYGMRYLNIPEVLHAQGVTKKFKTEINFTLEKDGKTFKKSIQAIENQQVPTNYGFVSPNEDWASVRDQSKTPYYLKNLGKIYYYEYLPDSKTVYVRHSQIQDDPSQDIPTFYEKVFDFIDSNDVERLVLDVRLNGGGNNYKNKPIVTGIIRSEKINKVGSLFVIIGRRTFSACQNLVNELDNYTNAIFVGEPTAENINFYGDNRPVELPNSKLTARLSFAWWQDKPQWENDDWLAPHLAVDMTFEEYQTNQDPVLDAALSFNDNQMILDPMEHLKDLFMAGKFEEVEKEAVRMVNDPTYRYFDFESAINRSGYNLLNSNQVESAIYVFQMNSQLFPESANCYDSLAEAHWKANDIEKAISLYKKAIEMDPNGSIGDNARSMLTKIESQK